MTAISENKVVSLTYELKILNDDGEQTLVETADESNPMVFLYGVSGLPEKFEEYLDGKQEGESFSFSLEAEEGYGEYDDNALVPIPKNVFEVDGKIDDEMLQEGNYIPMADNEGNHMQGRVMKIQDDEVVMDFNHPLAGMKMFFEGKVLSVREATPEEISHGHVHGAGGHHH
ncbi:FKBP-type peptidyl-prolyl cis-trans isomerase [Adhaeribacter rhizoryzae]|uniref:Peptidyl-prolyl cis-trans isomerase n=1 Tax=Adhaeribacter rhizoryzae TaxID=2607907 RepID=A0A5M6DK23_9BACT|nr:FKBP-type peptidyl-prolyl cis-trans isomerase [Adhaeribacter rhizoryzae]KAA5547904.1 peptidylprolyl isomerase [Adhaeribacter rhizoryzae]